jgi:hypothetical protein
VRWSRRESAYFLDLYQHVTEKYKENINVDAVIKHLKGSKLQWRWLKSQNFLLLLRLNLRTYEREISKTTFIIVIENEVVSTIGIYVHCTLYLENPANILLPFCCGSGI